MPRKVLFSESQLTKLAGSDAYEAGKALQNKVSGLELDSSGATAQVEAFSVKLDFRSNSIRNNNNSNKLGLSGACSCPESDGFDFCRHCVAVSLEVNQRDNVLRAMSRGPDKSKVLAYLLRLDKNELANRCLDLLLLDTEQFRNYLLKASLDTPDIDYAGLRSQVTRLTRPREKLFSQRQVKLFFAAIQSFLLELDSIAARADTDKLLNVVEYCVERINRVLDTVEDRGNQRHSCQEILQELYGKLIAQLPDTIEISGQRLFNLWLNDRHRVLGDHPDKGYFTLEQRPAFIRFFDTRCRQLWDEFASKGNTVPDDQARQQRKIGQYLLQQLEAEGKSGAQTEIRLQLARNGADYLQLAEEYLQQGKSQAVRQCAEQVLLIEAVQPGLRQQAFGYLERYSDALPLLQQAFLNTPDSPLYESLIRCANLANKARLIKQQCIEQLEQLSDHVDSSNDPALQRLAKALKPALLELQYYELIETLGNNLELGTEEQISVARHLLKTDQVKAFEAYQGLIEGLINKGLNRHYDQAIELLLELQPVLGPDQFSAYYNELRVRHRSKRHFRSRLQKAINI